MALDKVAGQIVVQAQEKASTIILQGNEEANRIIAGAMGLAQQQTEKIGQDTRRILDEIRQSELSGSYLNAKKGVMQAKKQLLDEIFLQATRDITAIDKAKRAQIIRNLLNKASKELPDAKFFYANEEDKKLAGSPKNISFKGAIGCIGGVIVENEDQSIRINYLFEEIFEKIKEEEMHGIAKRVFGKN